MRIHIMAAGAVCLLSTVAVHGQEAINFDSALQPGKGSTILRQQLRYFEAKRRTPSMNLDISQLMSVTSIVHGLEADTTLILNFKHMFREIENNNTNTSDRDNGFGDVRVMGKFNLWKIDTGPTDTTRFSVLGGLEIRSGDSNFSSDSYDPLLGLVLTKSDGRFGFDLAGLWKFNTAGGAADEFKYDAAITYRLMPEQYGTGKIEAVFGVLELNGLSETNGDNELFISPGLQYVTGQWAIEASIQLPVWQELDQRPEKDFIIGLIFRMYF
ncbi:MAG: transporter [Planctomycetes bacterium]|nr:transporter [Planctomycetota bacterium]